MTDKQLYQTLFHPNTTGSPTDADIRRASAQLEDMFGSTSFDPEELIERWFDEEEVK